ncbi:MAG: DNA-deoxyinosine glycosylase [Bacilli bacterium]|nr:DNA-deoxyinosine glycosylase [Bacilli bacterium]
MIIHPFKPVIFKESRVLILGSFPSVKSREVDFYYGNKNNRFFKILEVIFDEKIGESKEAKIDFLRRHKIALFDVVKSCEIVGSSDSSLSVKEVNDIGKLIENTDIEKILLNGKKAFEIFQKYIKIDKVKYFYIPSSSPANASFSLDRLVFEYRKQLEYLKG